MFFFFFKQKTAYEIGGRLVGSEMCIRDSCLCRSCINNAESPTVNPEEVPYDWHPCFFCDMCNNFDGESPGNMEREECHEYVIDDYHARQNRKKLRIVR